MGLTYINQQIKLINIYKDTDNYDRSDKDAIDPDNIHPIGKVFECFPKKYKIYNTHDWNLPKSMVNIQCSC